MRSLKCATSPTLPSIWDRSISTRTMTGTCEISWTHSSSIVYWSLRAASLRPKINSYLRVRRFRVPSSASWFDASLASWIISKLWKFILIPVRRTFGMKMYSREILNSTTFMKECHPISSSQASTAFISLSRNGTQDTKKWSDLWVHWWRRKRKSKSQDKVVQDRRSSLNQQLCTKFNQVKHCRDLRCLRKINSMMRFDLFWSWEIIYLSSSY